MHACTRARRARADDHVARRGRSSEEGEPMHLHGRTTHAASVLVVDDEASFRGALRLIVGASSMLMLIGEATSGEAAVALVRALEPDLVVMDVHMPLLGGISATRTHELPEEAARSGADAIAWKGDLRAELLEELWAQHGADATPGRASAEEPVSNVR